MMIELWSFRGFISTARRTCWNRASPRLSMQALRSAHTLSETCAAFAVAEGAKEFSVSPPVWRFIGSPCLVAARGAGR